MNYKDYDYVRQCLLNREEICLLDVREEAPHAEGHPLFAANFPFSSIELNAYTKLPRFDVPIVTIDSGEGLAEASTTRLIELGYTNVSVFEGGIEAWSAAGGELFIDVNVPSKSFGELLEATCDTPSMPAEDVKKMMDNNADMVVVDVRRFDEYNTMCIPTGISVPGAELVLRVPDLATNPETTVIVNCAGRTRSLVGAQSLVNSGLPNPVYALRNGTIGWTLAKQELVTGQSRTYSPTGDETRQIASERARDVADRAGVKRATKADLKSWSEQVDRTTYFFDVRSFDEYEIGHLSGFYPIPGGQLVQELEMYAPVRGARIVLADDDGARANMSASWLAQMAWDVYVLDGLQAADFSETGKWQTRLPEKPKAEILSPETLSSWIQDNSDVTILDFAKYVTYVRGHIPGANYLIRSLLEQQNVELPNTSKLVLTSDEGELAAYAVANIQAQTDADIFVLLGGTQAWVKAGYKLEEGETHLLSTPIDRYKRPYEGTAITDDVMQAYLDWEYGLVDQLAKDGTHHFRPLQTEN
ncbi:rhodanese-like domain-containing protein [Cocleimonas sp. KMM 6892]|uniref:rhodanese-like domain-containing protein n=1 Tax=unclassified Cocleimonas TaxID=2639732 RepID=UPI002DB72198|nr:MULTISPECIES: rhodanese-like domain-containing protein [unclassified Cocleimonas]MEB8432778.1 rhodanese-like domain-containing protein [Cocleimonas sp. KMM 6892]MEC4715637.1 rhodanese-like domain-containing protein [Cocleimonas sp. KMM 6895]MEC4744745.1 rhodanese-like domain-containing protein [Cocleimonas sp. KMM 6896]